MNKKEVLILMKSSQSESEWNKNVNIVKKSCGGFPSFWFTDIVESGLLKKIAKKWEGTDEIRIDTL